jgi:hypothetical protein
MAGQLAISMLQQWYSIWEDFQGNRSGEMRRLALHAKARGLVHHDRCLMQCEAYMVANPGQ